MRIEWLPVASDSLQEPLDCIGRRNPDAALSHSRRVESDVVTILRLFHGAQDWPSMP